MIVRVVVFDLMDTVLADPYREALEAGTGMTMAELREARGGQWSPWPAFERGELTEDEYWAKHEAAGLPIDRAAFHAARRRGYRFIDGMPELVAALESHVDRVVASNYPRWIDELRKGLLAGRFDAVYASCDFGVRKPEPAFFARLLAELDVPAETVLFVDDREPNVDAAEQVGLRGHRFRGAGLLRAHLGELGLPTGDDG